MWHYEMRCLVVLLDSRIGWIAVSIEFFLLRVGEQWDQRCRMLRFWYAAESSC